MCWRFALSFKRMTWRFFHQRLIRFRPLLVSAGHSLGPSWNGHVCVCGHHDDHVVFLHILDHNYHWYVLQTPYVLEIIPCFSYLLKWTRGERRMPLQKSQRPSRRPCRRLQGTQSAPLSGAQRSLVPAKPFKERWVMDVHRSSGGFFAPVGWWLVDD